ncbi:MAG: DUF2232 domain-containing protein, partial [Bacillota bacterium]|nr:DUF2232 domain-containing protein [Bacillota bacterium]
MTEIDEKSLEAENQEGQTAEPGKEEDSYSLPLSARSGSQWIPPHVLRSSSGSGPTAEAKLPEPGFTAAAWKESAFCTLFLLAFGLLVAYLPLLGVVASLFMPLLLAKLLLRRGLVLSLLALLLAFAADAFLLGLPSAASIFLQYGSMGLVFGLCYRKKKSGVLSLFLAALCCFLGHTFSIGLSFLQDGLSLTEFWPLMEKAYGESLRSLAQASGMVSTVNLDAFVEYGLSLLHRLLLPMNLLSAVV